MTKDNTPRYGRAWDKLLATFRRSGSGLTAGADPSEVLALGEVKEAPAVFQHRDQESWETRRHIEGLTAVLRREKGSGDDRVRALLEPIDVFAVAGRWYVLDGHCRLAAYKRAGLSSAALIPVRVVQGSLQEALAHSMGANTRDKLPLTKNEKLEAAWKLVLTDPQKERSARAIAKLTGVSPSTVTKMRTQLETALWHEDPANLTWAQVKRRKADVRECDEDWQDAQRERLGRRLRKHFGPVPDRIPDLFLDALFEVYPRVRETVDHQIEAALEESENS